MTKPLEEIRALTATLLHPIEVDAYVGDITEESILQMQGATDVDLFTESKPNVAMQINRYIGHDMRYDGDYYLFRAGEDLPVEWHPKLSHFEENLHPNLSHPNRLSCLIFEQGWARSDQRGNFEQITQTCPSRQGLHPTS